jgi:hypothetical protein
VGYNNECTSSSGKASVFGKERKKKQALRHLVHATLELWLFEQASRRTKHRVPLS